MKLDPRIIEGKRPLTCFDTEVAKGFIGKECYLSDGVASFANVDNLNKAVLIEVDDENIKPYTLENIRWRYSSNFILPCEWVKEPEEPENKWRPFTLDEFVKRFDLEVGTRVFLIRYKTTPGHQKRLLLTGLIQDTNPGSCGVCLGGFQFTFSDLFDMFDVRFGEKDWQPFGVEE